MRVNRFTFLAISLLLAIISCILYPVAIDQQFSDHTYVESLNFSANADSLGIPVVGAFLISIIFAIFHIASHIGFFVMCIYEMKKVKINLTDFWLSKKDRLTINILRVVGYIVIGFIIINYIVMFIKFFYWEAIFSLNIILVVCSYMLWIITLLRMRKDVSEQAKHIV